MQDVKSPKNHEKMDDLLHKLHQRFEGAIKFLKETSLNNTDQRTKLFNLPWFLMLGFHNTGKTTLLTHSELDFILSKKNHPEKQRVSHCEWWATRDAVFLDVNNAYTLQTRKTRRERKLWFDFLELIRQHRRQQVFDGVLFSIDIEKLCSTHKAERNAYFHSVRGRLKDLVSYTRSAFPLYLVITKVDKLAGFLDFFDHFSKEETNQLWGILFNQTQIHSPQMLADTFDIEYDKLLELLNQRLINRLHHERNLDKRALIKDFPLQVESIKKPLAAFLQNIADIAASNQACHLRGIYFCAALPQDETVIDQLLQPLTQTFALQHLLTPVEKHVHRAYFTKDIFRQLMRDKNVALTYVHKNTAKLRLVMQWSAAALCSVFVVCMVFSWIHGFSKNVAELTVIEQALAQYQILGDNTSSIDMHQTLKQLDTLAIAANKSEHAVIPWIMRVFMKQDTAVYKQASVALQKTIQLMIQRQLHQILTNQLNQGKQYSADKMYGTLRAYLMLHDKQHFDKAYIIGWLDKYWQQTNQLSVAETHKINFYLEQTLTQPLNSPPDIQLVAQVRDSLKSLPMARLVNTLIEVNTPGKSIVLTMPMIANHPIFTLPITRIELPAAYTAAHFAMVYDATASRVADVITNGDWVLRADTTHKPVDTQLVEQVRQLYISNYVAVWQNILGSLQLAPFNSYAEAVQIIAGFTQVNSATMQLLFQIAENTHVYYRNVPTPISLQFNTFHIAMQYNLPINRDNLVQLAGYLVSLEQNPHSAMAALELAKSHALLASSQEDAFYVLETQAKQAPQPAKMWFEEILKNSWALILKDAKQGINNKWAETVYPDFSNKIAIFYPFDKTSRQLLSKEDFAAFFADGGVLNNFMMQYLSPFVDMQNTDWKLKEFNGATLPLSSESMAILQQTQSIGSIVLNAQHASSSNLEMLQNYQLPTAL